MVWYVNEMFFTYVLFPEKIPDGFFQNVYLFFNEKNNNTNTNNDTKML